MTRKVEQKIQQPTSSPSSHELPVLKIVATYFDGYWHRQHFKGWASNTKYCEVEGRIHTFCGEPECPIRVEVTKRGAYVKHWQKAKLAGGV